MKNQKWALLDRVRDNLKAPSDIPPGLMAGVATRLEEAISAASSEPLSVLSAQLVDLVYALLHVAPPEAAKASRPDAPPALAAAYLLGQVGFAQRLASQAVDKRADESFLTIMKDSRYIPYVAALSQRDMVGRELAKRCREAEETVSRKLKALRAMGIADFRREGTSFINFLTPAALAVSKQLNLSTCQIATSPVAVPAPRAAIIRQNEGAPFQHLAAQQIKKLPPYLRHTETLSHSRREDLAPMARRPLPVVEIRS